MTQPTRLVIARHGNTFGPDDVVTRVGITDLPLVESGELQARQLGAYLLQENLIPHCIFTSPLKRTIRMAALAQDVMATEITPQQESFLAEIDYGPDENKPETEVIARLGEQALADWDTHALLPDGWNADIAAIKQGWQKFAAQILNKCQGKTILVITSNGVARFAPYLTGDYEQFKASYPLKLATGALGILEHNNNQTWQCRGWNIRPKHELAK